MNIESYKEAKLKFLSGDYSVDSFFQQNGFLLEYSYCKLLSGDITSAIRGFNQISENDLRANWALKLIQFINSYVTDLPSYFQIRNFLEIDINLLLMAKRPEFVECVINGADLFYSVNPESYKFISRVMFNNGFFDVSLYYLNRAKNKFYNDPEMHFMLANCYLKMGDKISAKKSAMDCLNILPEYFPAKKLLNRL